MKYLYCVIFLSLFSISNLLAENHENRKGYVIAFLDVQNKEIMMEYKKKIKPIVKKYKGKLIASSIPDIKEGYIVGNAAIIEFPSFENAQKWYNSIENQEAKAIRDKGVNTILLILKGK